jgi:hypothetical protein
VCNTARKPISAPRCLGSAAIVRRVSAVARVDRRRADRAVAEHGLDGAQVDAGLEQMGGVAVPQGVRRDGRNPRDFPRDLAAGVPDRSGDHRPIRKSPGKQPGLRPGFFPILAQRLQQLRRQRHLALPVALAELDPYEHALAVNVLDAQMRGFCDP